MGKVSLLARLALVVVVAVSLPSCSKAQGSVLTARQFQDRVVEEVVRHHPGAKVTRLDDYQLQIELPGGHSGTTHLERAYGLYEGTPSELNLIVQNIASSIGPRGQARAQDLLILVRPASFTLEAGPGEDSGPLLKRPLVGDLAAYVAVDRPDSYAMLRSSELRAQLKMEDAAIWAAAMQNTRAHLDFPRRAPQAGRIAEISTGEGLAASLLLLDEFWDSPELTSAGPLVVAVFARDNVLVTSLSDAKNVQALRKLMADVRDDPNGLTNDLIVRRNGRWEVLP